MRTITARFGFLLATSLMTSQPAVGQAPPTQANFFISGHSLTDLPLPTYLSSVARSLGTRMQWNRQYMIGSSIRARSRGLDEQAQARAWVGYHMGDNRDGSGLDVLSELRYPMTIGPGSKYDILIITEQNGLLETILWHDTVRHLRHYHERFIEGNAKGRTFFFEPWSSVDPIENPARWIELERKASSLWQCVVTRINLGLAAEHRQDRIASMPTGVALATLVERATQGTGVPGLTMSNPRATIARLFQDDVHLTKLGSYYVALVVYAAMFDRPPTQAWAPPEVDVELATTLQTIAWSVVSERKQRVRSLDMDQCRELLKGSLIDDFYGYMRSAWVRQVGVVRAEVRRLKRLAHWHVLVRRDTASNPFRFDAASDGSYWLPPPEVVRSHQPKARTSGGQ